MFSALCSVCLATVQTDHRFYGQSGVGEKNIRNGGELVLSGWCKTKVHIRTEVKRSYSNQTEKQCCESKKEPISMALGVHGENPSPQYTGIKCQPNLHLHYSDPHYVM